MKVIQFIISVLIIGSFFYMFTFQKSNIILKVFIFVLLNTPVSFTIHL